MQIEQKLESDIGNVFEQMFEHDNDVQILLSRSVSKKIENTDKSTIISIASNFRQNDAFSLSPITINVSIAILTRIENDPEGEKHSMIVDRISRTISRWHKFGNEMSAIFSTDDFFAGELRMDGGTPRTMDSITHTWSESIQISFRGSERFNNENINR